MKGGRAKGSLYDEDGEDVGEEDDEGEFASLADEREKKTFIAAESGSSRK